MGIIYNSSTFRHNTKELFAEGSYRTEGIKDIGKSIEIDFDVFPHIERVHTKEYIQKIKRYCLSNMPIAEIQTSEETFKASINSVGLALIATKNQDFAVTRPPGHHAEKEKAAGFCLCQGT